MIGGISQEESLGRKGGIDIFFTRRQREEQRQGGFFASAEKK
jgi:hypothetical protein